MRYFIAGLIIYAILSRFKGRPHSTLSQGRWRAFDYEELINRDKASLDIFWLKDESLEDSDNLPDPDILVREIVEDLQAALVQFQTIAEDLGETVQ